MTTDESFSSGLCSLLLLLLFLCPTEALDPHQLEEANASHPTVLAAQQWFSGQLMSSSALQIGEGESSS